MVVCEGKNEFGEPKICFCFNRQVRGCSDPTMKVSRKSREEIAKYIDGTSGLVW